MASNEIIWKQTNPEMNIYTKVTQPWLESRNLW